MFKKDFAFPPDAQWCLGETPPKVAEFDRLLARYRAEVDADAFGHEMWRDRHGMCRLAIVAGNGEIVYSSLYLL